MELAEAMVGAASELNRTLLEFVEDEIKRLENELTSGLCGGRDCDDVLFVEHD